MYCKSLCAAIQGIDGCIIHVEADISDGLPYFSMVGYLASEVKEAKERVRIAIKNSGFRLPPKKITVNLSPADIRKDGTGYDLSIALSILSAFGFLPAERMDKCLLLGELSLDGEIKDITGVLPMVYTAYENGITRAIVPVNNVPEARLVNGMEVVGASSLREAYEILQGEWSYEIGECVSHYVEQECLDFADIHGQSGVKRAVEVAVAGRHNILMIGPPGSGKSMIAKRIPGIMSELDFKEQMEITKTYSVAGLLNRDCPIVNKRPFRAPHHGASLVSLVGGGRYPKPGECSLSSGGVLFLDELPEFQRRTIEALRQPLEDGFVTVSRLESTIQYPARFQLVAAANPCPCGYYPRRDKCHCTENQIKRYFSKISRPILDRIDICAETVPVQIHDLDKHVTDKTSKELRENILKAQNLQRLRYQGEQYTYNGEMTPEGIARYCVCTDDAKVYLEKMFHILELSARSYHKVLKVGRTIADLDNSEMITKAHITEAICYRSFQDSERGVQNV